MNLESLRRARTALIAATLTAFLVLTAGGTPTAVPKAGAAAPRAEAGPARTVALGETVWLDATASTDADGDRLSYAWSLHAPPGSGARLSDPAAPRPRFTADVLGDYVAVLTVTDARGLQASDRVRVSTGNVAPVADAGPDRTAAHGQAIELDGSPSYDANGDALRYRWSIVSAPAGSRAGIDRARAAITTFAPDRDGRYVLALTVSDGRLDSAPAQVAISTGGSAPRAHAGTDRRVAAGAPVRLDPHRSIDADGDPLRFDWALLHAPAGSAATLAGAGPEPLLHTDLPGLYVAQLVAHDAGHASQPDTVVIEAFVPSVMAAAQGGGADTDGDGVPDSVDNCVEKFNPTQLDTNGDGFGNACDPDLDNDGFITNVGDLGILRLAFFSFPGHPNWNPDADFNGDNVVNVVDLAVMREFFFGPPGPIAITFINPAGGDWHDPANWAPPVVPDIRYSVRIDLDPAVVVEYSAGSSNIAGLRATSPVLITGGELSIQGDARFDGGLTVQDGATLADANILAPTAVPAPAILIPVTEQATFDEVTTAQDIFIETGATLSVENGLSLDSATITIASQSNQFSTLAFVGPSSASALDGTGEILFAGTSSVESRNRLVANSSNHDLTIGPGITVRSETLGGFIGSTFANGAIVFQGTVIADVSGDTVSMNGWPLTFDGIAQVSNDAAFEATFNDVGSSITAAATLDANTGELELFGDFVNNGTVTATDAVLDIGNTAGDEWSNAGTIAITNSTFEAGGLFTLTALGTVTGTGTTVLDGTFDNTGQTVDLDAVLPGATLLFDTGGGVLGGTLTGTPLSLTFSETVVFDGVTLEADVTIERNATLNVVNGMTMAGSTISIESESNQFTTLGFTGPNGAVSTLGGAGEVVFNGTSSVESRNRIAVNSSTHGLTIGAGITVRSGTIGGAITHPFNNGPIVIEGDIVSDVTAETVSAVAAPLTLSGSVQVTNDAIFQATFNGVGSSIGAATTLDVNTGEIELFGDFVNFGTITVTDSTLDLGNQVGDEWSNSGTITLVNGTLELGGTFTLAEVGNATGTGTTVINGTFDNTGQTVDLLAALPGSVNFANGATVLGGTVNGGALLIPLSQTVVFDGIVLGADVTIERNATLNIANGMTMAGSTISIESESNNFTTLGFTGPNGGMSTLGGTGEVVFNGTSSVESRNRMVVNSSGHGATIGPDITVRSGTIGGATGHAFNNGPFVFQGTVISNVTGDTVSMNGAPLAFDGAAQVSNDAAFEASFNGAGSTIGATAALDANTGEIELFGDFVSSGTITVTDATLDIGNVVGDEWDNDGTITLSNATFELGGTFTLADVGTATGTGTSVINGTFDNTGQTVDLQASLPGTVTFGNGGVVLGGTVNGGTLLIPLSQTVVFDGVTLGADITIERNATLNLANGMTMAGSTISIESESNNFTTLGFTGPNGGMSTLGGTGEVVFNGTSSVESRNRLVVNSSGHGATVGPNITVRSGTLGGAIGHAFNNGPLVFQGTVISNVTIDVVTMNGAPLTFDGSAQVSNDAEFEASFNGVGSTIGAAATLDVNTGELELFGDFVSSGTITATDSTLDIGNLVGDEWDNDGTITLSNATFELGGTFTLADVGTATGTGTSVINGTFDNTGQNVDLATALPGTVSLGNGGTVLGGTLSGSALTVDAGTAVFDGVTLAADVTIASNATLNVANDLTMAASTISIESESNQITTLGFTGGNGATSTLGGTGDVVFNGTSSVEARNRIVVNSSFHNLDIGSGVTVSTGTLGGFIGHPFNNGSITITGTVVADHLTDEVTMNGAPLTIDGTLHAGAGGTFDLNDYTLGSAATVAIDIGGTAVGDFGRVLDSSSDVTLDGTLDLNLVNGFSPSLGDTFQIMTFDSRIGTFAATTGTAIGGGLSFQVNHNATDVTLQVVN